MILWLLMFLGIVKVSRMTIPVTVYHKTNVTGTGLDPTSSWYKFD